MSRPEVDLYGEKAHRETENERVGMVAARQLLTAAPILNIRALRILSSGLNYWESATEK